MLYTHTDPPTLAIPITELIKTGTLKTNTEIPNDYKIYWIIREPFKRMVSCFINKFIVYNNTRLSENKLEHFSRKLLSDIGITYEELTFNKFLDGIEMLMKHDKNIDPHFNLQVNETKYNKIKSREIEFVKTSEISQKLKIEYHTNKTPYVQIHENPVDYSDVLAGYIDHTKLNTDYFESAHDRVREIYHYDYQILGRYFECDIKK